MSPCGFGSPRKAFSSTSRAQSPLVSTEHCIHFVVGDFAKRNRQTVPDKCVNQIMALVAPTPVNDQTIRFSGPGVTKEVGGIHVRLTHSLFASDIPRRLLRRVSLAKPTSAHLLC
jgi:hypothetical protein